MLTVKKRPSTCLLLPLTACSGQVDEQTPARELGSHSQEFRTRSGGHPASTRAGLDFLHEKPGDNLGTYKDNEDVSLCPADAAIPHGDPFLQGEPDSYLAKDDPDSLHHETAVAMATDQTTEEFCRLARLVTLRHGNPGREQLLNEWVSDRAGYEAACPDDLSIVTAVFMTAI